jgi:hypothetical protein
MFNRAQKCFDHLGVDIVPIELIQLRQPEIIAGVIERGFRSIVWIPLASGVIAPLSGLRKATVAA